MKIRISALDTLFFRDGRPFDRGEESWAKSIFPPSPATIYGAIRAAYLNQMPEVVPDSEEDLTQNIRIKGIYYEYDDTPYLPAPKDLVYFKQKDEATRKHEEAKNEFDLHPASLSFQENIGITSLNKDLVPQIAFFENDEVEDFTNGIFPRIEFNKYASRKVQKVQAKKGEQLWNKELKTGIGLEKSTAAVREGDLYHVSMSRPNGLNILVDYEVPEYLKEHTFSLIKIGGEQKAAHVSEFDFPEDFKEPPDEQSAFKIYLLTPAFFADGWNPGLEKWLPNHIQIKLEAAFVDKPEHYGGFDIKANAPKPMLKAAPAGSVYYYNIVEGSFKEIKDALSHINTINSFQDSDLLDEKFREQKNKEGFGLFKLAYKK